MGNTLEQLDHLINETLKPENLKASPLTEPQIEELILLATSEEKAIRMKIQTGYINAKSHKKYIHKLYGYQIWVIELSNALSKHFYNYKEYTQLYDHYFVILDDLVIFLEETFPRHFNYDLQVSDERKLVVIQNLKCRIRNLQALAKHHAIDTELVNIIAETIREYFYNLKDYPITFRIASYFETLFKSIFEAIENGPIEDKTQALISALHTTNFNHTRFSAYLTRQVTKQTSSTASKYVQIEKVYAFKMQLQQTPFGNPDVILFPGVQLPRDFIGIWLNDLLSYLDRAHQAALIMPPAEVKQTPLVEFNLSVAQLSFALKVAIDTEAIINISHKQLSEITSAGCKTSGTSKISSESLRTKSNPDRVARMRVKDLLIKMLNYVNKTA